MIRGIALLVGMGLMAATAHVTIISSGGYWQPHAVLTLMIEVAPDVRTDSPLG